MRRIRTLRLATVLLALAVCGCVRYDQPYAPDTKREPLTLDGASKGPMTFVRMNAPDIENYIVSDIRGLEDGWWRWTGQRPTLDLGAPAGAGVVFAANFHLPEVTFRNTGPVTVAAVVNGREIGRTLLDSQGDKVIEYPVPDGLLKPGQKNRVEMALDKVWTDQGVQFGVTLDSVRFVKQ